jgi:hypothetical protein
MTVLERIRAFFDSPQRQAIGWAAIGILGLALLGGGMALVLGGGGGGSQRADPDSGRTLAATQIGSQATATNSPSSSPSASPSPEATSPSITPVAPQPQGGGGGGTSNPPTPQPTPVPTATPAPSGKYCPSDGGSSAPPNAVFGLVTIGGAAAPAGTVLALAFDGVPGPTATVTVEDGKAGYRMLYAGGGGDCANKVGAAMSLIVNGQAFSTGGLVGGGVALRFDVVVP